jgi:hypothetical protein
MAICVILIFAVFVSVNWPTAVISPELQSPAGKENILDFGF